MASVERDVKARILQDHLEFIQEMLIKVKGTAYEEKWKKTLNLVRTGK